MDKRQNKYSIRKFTFGASSILIGSLLFLGVGTAQAAEEDHHTETKVQQLNGNQLGNDKQEKLVNETSAIPVENDHTQANDEKNTTYFVGDALACRGRTGLRLVSESAAG